MILHRQKSRKCSLQRQKKNTIIDDHEQSFGSYRHVCLDCDGNFMGENVCYALDVCTL